MQIAHRIRVLLTEPTGCTLTDSSGCTFVGKPFVVRPRSTEKPRNASFHRVSGFVSPQSVGKQAGQKQHRILL